MGTNKKPDVPLSIIGFGVLLMAMVTVGALVGSFLAFGRDVLGHFFLFALGCANELGCTGGTAPTWLGKVVISLFNLH